MKFQKVRNTWYNPPLEYDWMLVIESLEELNDYHKKLLASKIRAVWENLIETQERKSHIDNKFGYLIHLEAEKYEKNPKSLIELTAIVSGKIYAAKAQAILNCGKIYVGKLGGFFPHSKDIEVIDEFISDNFIFPNYTEKDIHVKQWEGGTHWYAYIGDLLVEETENGEKCSKWDSEFFALNAAKRMLYRLKNEHFAFKTK
jgi:hypothetical protein